MSIPAIEFSYKLMLEERSIRVLAYNLSTILAEKLETIISRGDQNTRPRDYYDVFILSKLKTDNVEMQELKDAFFATTTRRGSTDVVNNYKAIMEVVRKSEVMKRQWNDYRKEFEYASEIEFEDTCDTVISLMNQLSK